MKLEDVHMVSRAIALLGVLVAGQSFAAEIPVWAMMLNDEWHIAYNNRNPEGFKTYYSQDVRLNNLRGYGAAVQSIEEEWKQENLYCTGGFVDFNVVNRYASGWGVGACRANDAPASEAFAVEWLTVFEQQSNGDWIAILEEWTE